VHPWEASAGRHVYRLNTVNLAVGAAAEAEAAEAATAQQQHLDPQGGWWADEAVADGWTVVADRHARQDTALADGGTGGPGGAAPAPQPGRIPVGPLGVSNRALVKAIWAADDPDTRAKQVCWPSLAGGALAH
jgi:hypothetical protein